MEKLVAAMDSSFEEPERKTDLPFLMSIESAVNIQGRGAVATGTIEQGVVKMNEEVHMIGVKRKHTTTTITGIETFHKQMDKAEAGDNIGALLRGINKD